MLAPEWVVSIVLVGFALVARLCVGGLLTASALHQLADLRSFKTTVESYRILSLRAAHIAAAPIAVAELAFGMALVLGLAPRLVSAGAAALLVSFGGAMLVNLARDRRISCGCTGGADEPISLRHVVRNAGLVAMLLTVFLAPSHPWSVELVTSSSNTARAASWIDGTVAVFVAAAIWLVWSMFTKVRTFTWQELNGGGTRGGDSIGPSPR